MSTTSWKPGGWCKSARGKPAVAWWRHGVAAKGEPPTVTQIRIYANDAERYDAVMACDKPWVMNRSPFLIDDDGFKVNGVLVRDIQVDEVLSASQLEEATGATNRRFGNVLRESEGAFGAIDERKYECLIESFIGLIVKGACSSSAHC